MTFEQELSSALHNLLPPEDLQELIRRYQTPKTTLSTSKAETQHKGKWCPETPSERQSDFLKWSGRESLYGGSAGGGKSSALLMAAAQYVDRKDYAALLLRRTYADLALPGALMDRAHSWWQGSDAKWEEKTKTWHFPAGATVTFGYLETEKDKFRYQGAEFQFIGFDELSQFTETQYTYLLSRLRKKRDNLLHLRMRSATNPGGEGHEWVKNRFLVSGRYHEVTLKDGRRFVPARMEENPGLDHKSYIESLEGLDPLTKAQLLNGDWDALPENRLFKRHWFKIQDAAPATMRRVRFWDMAATEPKAGKDPDYAAGALVGRTKDGEYYVEDIRRVRETPKNLERLILQTAETDGRAIPIRMEQEPGSSGVALVDHYMRHILSGYDFGGVRPTGPKETRAHPVSAQAEAGNIFLVQNSGWNKEFLDEFGAFPSEGVHDDQVDAVSGAFEFLTSKRAITFYKL